MNISKTLCRGILAALISIGVLSVQAAPLPSGTLLSITPGNSPGNAICTSGSCFAMEVTPDFFIWTNIAPGTDGGLIVDKSQKSGGQDLGPSASNTTPGELTAAWFFFGNYGTFYTISPCFGICLPGDYDNLFDDSSCSSGACAGKTTLKTWNVAWNGVRVPLGSALGCQALDTTKCVGVSNWTLTPSPAVTGSSYVLDYAWAVPDGDPSGFGNVPFSLHLQGATTLPCDVTVSATASASTVLDGQSVIVDASAIATNCTIVSYKWSATGGSFEDPNAARTVWNAPLVSADTAYTLTATVTTDTGKTVSASITIIIVIWNQPHVVADAGADVIVKSGQSFALTGTCFTNIGTISTCNWTFPTDFVCTQDVTGLGTFEPTSVLSCTAPTIDVQTAYPFTLTAVDDVGIATTDSTTVTVIPLQCTDLYPLRQVTTNGGGQSPQVNATLFTTFTGHIVSVTNNSITVCLGTPLQFEAFTTVGIASCTISGTATASVGALFEGSRLICSNRPAGSDTDRFRVVGAAHPF